MPDSLSTYPVEVYGEPRYYDEEEIIWMYLPTWNQLVPVVSDRCPMCNEKISLYDLNTGEAYLARVGGDSRYGRETVHNECPAMEMEVEVISSTANWVRFKFTCPLSTSLDRIFTTLNGQGGSAPWEKRAVSAQMRAGAPSMSVGDIAVLRDKEGNPMGTYWVRPRGWAEFGKEAQ